MSTPVWATGGGAWNAMQVQRVLAKLEAYAARKKAGYTLPVGRGIWLSLYEKEADAPVTLVGAGAGLDHPAIATVPLVTDQEADSALEEPDSQPIEAEMKEAPLTIPEAKRRLALSLGVSEADIKIIING